MKKKKFLYETMLYFPIDFFYKMYDRLLSDFTFVDSYKMNKIKQTPCPKSKIEDWKTFRMMKKKNSGLTIQDAHNWRLYVHLTTYSPLFEVLVDNFEAYYFSTWFVIL